MQRGAPHVSVLLLGERVELALGIGVAARLHLRQLCAVPLHEALYLRLQPFDGGLLHLLRFALQPCRPLRLLCRRPPLLLLFQLRRPARSQRFNGSGVLGALCLRGSAGLVDLFGQCVFVGKQAIDEIQVALHRRVRLGFLRGDSPGPVRGRPLQRLPADGQGAERCTIAGARCASTLNG